MTAKRQRYIQAVWFSSLLLALLVLPPGAAGNELRLRVIAEEGHPADTLYSGFEGNAYLSLLLSESDSVDALVLVYLLSSPDAAAPLDTISPDDWQWLGAFASFDAQGFNSSYRDGVLPDSGLLFATIIQADPAPAQDTLVARVRLRAISTGTVHIQPIVISEGLVMNETSIMLTRGGYRSVDSGLVFQAPDIMVTDCPSVTIMSNAPADTLLCREDSLHLALSILGATDVSVTGDAVLADSLLCFAVDTGGTYRYSVVAANQCSADTLAIELAVGFRGIPDIACPSDTIEIDVPSPREIKIPIAVNAFDSVTTSIGLWDADTLRLTADSSGLYTPLVTAWGECGESTCSLATVVVVGCCTLRGDFDMSGGYAVSDLTGMIAYLFRGGPPPPCDYHGDVDASGGISVADLTYLISFLFRGGSPPPPC